MHVCIYIYIYIYTFIYISMYMYIYMYIHMYIYMYTHACVFIFPRTPQHCSAGFRKKEIGNQKNIRDYSSKQKSSVAHPHTLLVLKKKSSSCSEML